MSMCSETVSGEKEPAPKESEAILREIRTVHSSYMDIELELPYVAENARPGQFVMVKGWKGYDPILLRPFDIVTVDRSRGTFRIVAKMVGRGTHLLGELSPGDRVRVLGPLGNGVELPEPKKSGALGFLVRGVGSAAVVFLAEKLHERGIPVRVYFSAADSGRLVCREYLEPLAEEMHIATDDGSEGYHGDARDLVDPAVKKGEIDRIYTCGSRRFARYVQEATLQKRTEGYLFLEGYMACGIGDCHGCAVKKAGRDDYYLVCQDGPVFSADAVEIE